MVTVYFIAVRATTPKERPNTVHICKLKPRFETLFQHEFADFQKSEGFFRGFFQRCRRLLPKSTDFVCSKVSKNGAASLTAILDPKLCLGLL